MEGLRSSLIRLARLRILCLLLFVCLFLGLRHPRMFPDVPQCAQGQKTSGEDCLPLDAQCELCELDCDMQEGVFLPSLRRWARPPLQRGSSAGG